MPKKKPTAPAKKKPAPAPTDTTHVCVVLDRSGSMQARRADALGGVNSYIEAAKADKNLRESRLSLITFSTVNAATHMGGLSSTSAPSIKTVRDNEPVDKIRPIELGEYPCDGWTPLYDAIGSGIGLLDAALAKGKKKTGGKAVLVVMTDGLENASKEFTRERIAELIEARKKDGWMIVFLGEGLDAAKQGLHIGTSIGSTSSIDKSAYRTSGDIMRMSVARYAASQSFDAQLSAAENALTAAEKKILQTGKKAKR